MYNFAVMFTFALWDIVPAQHQCEPMDCYDLKCFRVSKAKDGPHTIYPGNSELASLQVSCDQEADNGGWIMSQRRVDGTLNFTRNWQDYRDGFGTNGDGTTELWLGNEKVYQMMQSYGNIKCELRIEVDAFDGTSCWLVAADVQMYSEGQRYKMEWGRIRESESGLAANWEFHELLTFKAQDKADGKEECLRKYKGGWWYGNDCARIFLNGVYVNRADSTFTSISVRSFKFRTALQRSRMMFRPALDRPCYNPCFNGGTCDHVTNPKGRRCRCTSEFCGEKCEDENPCQNNGICEYVVATKTHSCECTSNFCGASCELSNPCKNAGTCEYDANTRATTCKCGQEFSGPTCEDASCEGLPPCKNKGTCEYNDVTESHYCKCTSNFCGATCELANPCLNNGICEYDAESDPEVTRCKCKSKFCGATCQLLNPCQNNGTCEYNAATDLEGPRCKCTSNFCGLTCELANPCQNNGICEYDTTKKSSICKCAPRFSGPICEDEDTEFVIPPAIMAVVFGLLLLLLLIAACVCIGVILHRRRKKKRLEQRQLADQELPDFMAGFYSFFGMNQ